MATNQPRFALLRSNLGTVVGKVESRNIYMWGHLLKIRSQSGTRMEAIASKMEGEYRWAFTPNEKVSPITSRDRVLDIGAHIGLFAIPAALQGAKVHAFEPAPASYQLLKFNRNANDVSIRLFAFPEAIGSVGGKTVLHTSGYGTTGHSTARYKRGGESIAVDVRSFKEVLKEFKPTVVKIDAEGIEHALLTEAFTAGSIRLMLVEWHFLGKGMDNIDVFNKALATLRRAGFTIRKPTKQPNPAAWFTMILAIR